MPRATWYLTEDGKPVDPRECGRKNGVLVHKSGAKIAMRFPDCPRSTGVDLDAKGKPLFGGKGDHDKNGTTGGAASPVEEAPADDAPDKKTEDMQAEEKPAPAKRGPYKTRGK